MSMEILRKVSNIPPVKVVVKKNGIFIRFSKTKPYDKALLEKSLRQRELTDFSTLDGKLLEQAFKNPDETWHKIGEYTKPKDNSFESSLSISINQNKTIATIIMSEPKKGGRTLDFDEVMHALKESGITHGILFDNVKELTDEELINTTVMVAQADELNNQEKDHVIYYYLEKVKKENAEKENIDYHSFLNSVYPVKRGEFLAEVILLQNGQWQNIMGQVLISQKPRNNEGVQRLDGIEEAFAKGEKPQAILIAGKNIILSPDGSKFYAAADGHVSLSRNVLNVTTIFIVEKDVDYSIGNIDFSGDVLIKGNVKPGFIVKSMGSILVEGFVQEARLIAGGSIIVKSGANRSYLEAGRHVMTSFLDKTEIHTKGDLYVKQELINCYAYSQGRIVVFTGKGTIIGGETVAKKLILTKKIGSEGHTKTTIIVGKDPSLEKAKTKLLDRGKTLDLGIDKLQKLHDRMKEIRGQSDQEKSMNHKISRALRLYKEKHVYIQNELENLELYIKEHVEKGLLSVKNRVYPGVKVMINDSNLEIKDLLQGRNFMLKNKTILIEPYENHPIEKDLEAIIAKEKEIFNNI